MLLRTTVAVVPIPPVYTKLIGLVSDTGILAVSPGPNVITGSL